jgi:hypothetical protein
MSTVDPGNPAAEAEVLAGLSRLARKGAYAAPVDAATIEGRQYAVFSPRNGFARAIATISDAMVACACRQGWLAAEQDGARLRLSAAGARALRRARSGGGGPPSCQTRDKQSAPRARGAAPPTPGVGKQESPLAWLRRRKDKDGRPLISEAQFTAGERLRNDYWRGQLMPRVTADWSQSATSRRTRRAGPGVGVELGDGVVAARQRVGRAMRAVGPELASILIDVCCHEMGLQAAGRAQAWPERATKVVLDLALTRLARHYGLIPPDPSPGILRLRHWGEEGYKPTLDAWRG